MGEEVRNKEEASYIVLYHMYIIWNFRDEKSKGGENVNP
jgi:hypothetical protein